MSFADFVHLRVHSAYSLSEGAIKTKQLVELARRQQMPAVAITDTGNLFGAWSSPWHAKDAGVQPIIGCPLPVTRPDEPEAPGHAAAAGPAGAAGAERGRLSQPDEAVQRCLSSDTEPGLMRRRSRCRAWRRTRRA